MLFKETFGASTGEPAHAARSPSMERDVGSQWSSPRGLSRGGGVGAALFLLLSVIASCGGGGGGSSDCSSGCHGAVSLSFGLGTCTYLSMCGNGSTEPGGCPASDPTAGPVGGCCAGNGGAVCFYGPASDIATAQANCVGGSIWTSG